MSYRIYIWLCLFPCFLWAQEEKAAFDEMNVRIEQLDELIAVSNKKEAEEQLLQTLRETDDLGYTAGELVVLNKLSEFYLSENQIDKALESALEGIELEKNFSQPALRGELYETLSVIYLEKGDSERSRNYRGLYRALRDSLDRAGNEARNKDLNRIVDEKQTSFENSRKKSIQLFLLILLLVIAGMYLLWKRNLNRMRKKYENIIRMLEEDFENRDKSLARERGELISLESVEIEFQEEKSEIGISLDTLEELKKKLEKFEKSEHFIKSDVSLPYLISKLGTNSKYLHHVLKEEKGKSFNQYINDLRIEYIVAKLYNTPKYREYKVEYLAEASGFQSRSTFIKAFKTTTGLTPSYFIKMLSEKTTKA